MLNLSADVRNDNIIVMDKKGNIVFSTLRDDDETVINHSNIDGLINSHDKRFFLNDHLISVDKIVNRQDLLHVLIIRNKSFESTKDLLPYKNSNTGFYDTRLLEDVKEGVIDLNFLKDYSVILVDVDKTEDINGMYEKSSGELVIDRVDKLVIDCIRDEDIPIRFSDNQVLIITPVVKKEDLDKLMSRIENVLSNNNSPAKLKVNISTAASQDSNDMAFLEVLHSAEKSLREKKMKRKFLEFDKEDEISNKIEKVRQELHSMISQYDDFDFEEDIVEMSQYLDKLLVEYERSIGRD